jgi:hypothetical protein
VEEVMLEHLRRRIAATLADTRAVTLATFGPADLQASILPCEADELRLFVLVPRASDQLFNLENNPSVVATADHWELRGHARVMPPAERPASLSLVRSPEARWSEVVEIWPERVQIFPELDGSQPETIDVN